MSSPTNGSVPSQDGGPFSQIQYTPIASLAEEQQQQTAEENHRQSGLNAGTANCTTTTTTFMTVSSSQSENLAIDRPPLMESDYNNQNSLPPPSQDGLPTMSSSQSSYSALLLNKLWLLTCYLFSLIKSLLSADNTNILSKLLRCIVSICLYTNIWTKYSLTVMGLYTWLLHIHQYLLAIVSIVSVLVGSSILLVAYDYMWNWRQLLLDVCVGNLSSSSIALHNLTEEEQQQEEHHQQQEALLNHSHDYDRSEVDNGLNTTDSSMIAHQQQLRRRVVVTDDGSNGATTSSSTECQMYIRYALQYSIIVILWGFYCYINTIIELWIFHHYMTGHPDHNMELIVVNNLESALLLLGATYTLYYLQVPPFHYHSFSFSIIQ